LPAAGPFTVTRTKKAKQYIEKNPRLRTSWPSIEAALIANPYPIGTNNPIHLWARLYCNHRWREGDFRLLYEIIEDAVTVSVFHAGPRGDVYGKD
jgi:mRNA-degrading endonuclease RelE of RelBE toxin-antitoxin system